VSSVEVWGKDPAEIEIGVISTAKSRLLVTLFLSNHENICLEISLRILSGATKIRWTRSRPD